VFKNSFGLERSETVGSSTTLIFTCLYFFQIGEENIELELKIYLLSIPLVFS
jgi:hypothetical protein